jgi:hypothetical protein
VSQGERRSPLFASWLAHGWQWLTRQRFFLLIGFTYFYFHQGSDPNQTSRLALIHALVERGATDITPSST